MPTRLTIIAPAALLLCLACEAPPPTDPTRPPAAEPGLVLHIDRSAATVLVGQTTSFSAVITDRTGQTVVRPLRWAARGLHIVSVDSLGNVFGRAPGDDWIFVSDGAHLLDSARVSVRIRFRSIHAGGDVTCALTPEGHPACWGSNAQGSVGDGGIADALIPSLVEGGRTFQTLVTGGGSTCGLAGDGAAYCWGYNGVGQLGDGTTRNRPTPVLVADSFAFVGIVIGVGATTCGRDAARGLFCWGWNAFNQLLDGTGFNWRRPVAVGVSFDRITSGGGHLCGLDNAGSAWCWGRNDYGQLGDGSSTSRFAPTLVAGGVTFVQLAAGREHTCGRTAAGEIYCWGHNDLGQLGGFAAADRAATPQPVKTVVTFDTVVTSGNHTCALAAKTAYCWGSNASGQAGRGDNASAIRSPEVVAGGLRFTSISAGTNHTCGMAVDGTAWCWGRNVGGAVGNGSRVDMLAPERVAFQP